MPVLYDAESKTRYGSLVSLATRISVIVGDVIALMVTWSKTAQAYYESRRLGIDAPLARLLYRDGEWPFDQGKFDVTQM